MAAYLKDNPNAPRVTFRMIRGRVIPIIGGKQPRGATEILRREIDERTAEVKHAVRGERGVGYNENREVVKNFATYSTFPPFFRELKFSSKEQFLNVVEKKKGKKYEDLVQDSIDGLLQGRESSFGRIAPDEQFRIATRQVFDNRGVIFRRIDGRIVPLRPKLAVQEEVPF